MILAAACRRLLIKDVVRTGSPGPWTAWNQFLPSNPGSYFVKERLINMSTVDYSYVQADNTRGKKDKEGVFTLGAL